MVVNDGVRYPQTLTMFRPETMEPVGKIEAVMCVTGTLVGVGGIPDEGSDKHFKSPAYDEPAVRLLVIEVNDPDEGPILTVLGSTVRPNPGWLVMDRSKELIADAKSVSKDGLINGEDRGWAVTAKLLETVGGRAISDVFGGPRVDARVTEYPAGGKNPAYILDITKMIVLPA